MCIYVYTQAYILMLFPEPPQGFTDQAGMIKWIPVLTVLFLLWKIKY